MIGDRESAGKLLGSGVVALVSLVAVAVLVVLGALAALLRVTVGAGAPALSIVRIARSDRHVTAKSRVGIEPPVQPRVAIESGNLAPAP